MKIKKMSWLLALTLLAAVFVFWQKNEIFLEENKTEVTRNVKPEKIKLPKGTAPRKVFEYLEMIKTGANETAPSYKAGYQVLEYQKAVRKAKNARIEDDRFTWKERGPGNVPGRTRAFALDLSDPSQKSWFAAGVNGGIWRTTDEGLSWKHITQGMPTLSVCALSVAPSNPNVIYAGTGESRSGTGSATGNGMMKSMDKGQTWQMLSSTLGRVAFEYINSILIDPKNADNVVIGTGSGVYYSDDGGASWINATFSQSTAQVQAMGNIFLAMSPQNFLIQYAAVHGYGVLKTIDGGRTWVEASEGIANAGTVGSMSIAVSATNSNKVFICMDGSPNRIYFTEDGAKTWQQLRETNNKDIEYLGGQGFWNNTVAVNPFDDNEVWVGGVNVWKVNLNNNPIKQSDKALQAVRMRGTQGFFGFQRVTGFTLWDGRLDGNTNQQVLKPVEMRFGKGKKQKAHRFLVPPNRSSGVPDSEYKYEDYVDVPFEVWDTESNKQLMVSFRDQSRNGLFDVAVTDDVNFRGREYLYIHTLPYDAQKPASQLMTSGGNAVDRMYFMWNVPSGNDNSRWTPDNLPESSVAISFGTLSLRESVTTQISDAYGSNGVNGSQLHPDHHLLTLVPKPNSSSDFTVYSANDGGMALSRDKGISFEHRGSGYNTTQFYFADKRTNMNQYIGGTQDNGTWMSPNDPDASSNYATQLGGDGFAVVWHGRDPLKMLGTIYYNNIRRTDNAGGNWRQAVSGLTDYNPPNGKADSLASFVTKLGYSKDNPDVVFAVGYNGVWRSANFADSWTKISMGSNWIYRPNTTAVSGSASPLQIAVSQANQNIVWAGGGMTEATRMHLSTDQGRTFRAVNNFSRPIGACSGLATHPTEPNTAYVLFSAARSPKVLRTKDAGQTWEDLSGFGSGTASTNGFPDVSIHSLVAFRIAGKIWVGTEIGIFETNDDGKSWNL